MDIQIIQETVPGDPQLISVSATSTYVDEKLNFSSANPISYLGTTSKLKLIRYLHILMVSLNRLWSVLSSKERFYIQVALFLDGANFTTSVNSSFCMTTPSVCSVAFNASSEKTVSRRNNYTVSIQAINSTIISGFLSGKSV